VAQAAHALRGASLTVGVGRASDAAAALERAARSGDAAGAAAAAETLRAVVEATIAALRGPEASLLTG
jgi:HPt (histidine-containing phosphotransfer) domain-containing protein